MVENSTYSSNSSNPAVSYGGSSVRNNYNSYNTPSKSYTGTLNANKGIYANQNNLDGILKYGSSNNYNSSVSLNFQQDIKYDPVQSKYSLFQNNKYQSDQGLFSQTYIRPNPTEKPKGIDDTKPYLPKILKIEKEKLKYEDLKIKDINECRNCVICHNCGRKR